MRRAFTVIELIVASVIIIVVVALVINGLGQPSANVQPVSSGISDESKTWRMGEIWIRLVSIEGHDYLVITSDRSHDWGSVIHAESCACKMKAEQGASRWIFSQDALTMNNT